MTAATIEQAHQTSPTMSSNVNSPPLSAIYLSDHPLRQTAKLIIEKAKSNQYVKNGVEHIKPYATQLKPYATPVIERVQPMIGKVYHDLGDPMLNTVDEKLAAAIQSLPELRRILIVENQWFQQVNSILLSSTGTSAEQISENVQKFWNVASEQFITAASRGRLMKDEFINSLKTQMNTLWDENLRGPAEYFFEQAKNFYNVSAGNGNVNRDAAGSIASIREQLDSRITAIYQRRLRQPARALYDSAVAKYMALSEQGTVSVTEFILSIKAQLGSAWNDRLEGPLVELWSKLNQRPKAELLRLHSYLDANKEISIADVVQSTRVATTTVIKGVHDLVHYTWQGVLGKTMSTIDKVLPDKEVQVNNSPEQLNNSEDKENQNNENQLQDLTIRKIRKSVGNRIKSEVFGRVLVGYSAVKGFSANRVAPIVHIDPVLMTENLIKKQAIPVAVSAQTKVEHLVHKVETTVNVLHGIAEVIRDEAIKEGQQLVDASGIPKIVASARDAAQSARKVAHDKRIMTRDAIHETRDAIIINYTPESVKHAAPILHAKLRALKLASIELSVTSSHLLIHEPIRQLPHDVIYLVKHLPGRMFAFGHHHVDVENDPTGILGKVDHLLDAVKDLLFWSKEQKQEVKKEICNDVERSQEVEKYAQFNVQKVSAQVNDAAKQIKEAAANLVAGSSPQTIEPVTNGIKEAVELVQQSEQEVLASNDAKVQAKATAHVNHNAHQKRSKPHKHQNGHHQHNGTQNHPESQSQPQTSQ